MTWEQLKVQTDEVLEKARYAEELTKAGMMTSEDREEIINAGKKYISGKKAEFKTYP